MTNTPRKLWTPSLEFQNKTNIHQFMDWLKAERDLSFSNYDELWNWSTGQLAEFWTSILDYFDVQYSGEFSNVTTGKMPKVRWFEGIKLNYAEHIFLKANDQNPALIFQSDQGVYTELTWKELFVQVANFAAYLKQVGVKKGDRVVAYVPNIPEATISFLAVNSIGAVWSSCSPDFGVNSVVDRFRQIEPIVFIGVNGYWYNGKQFDRRDEVKAIAAKLSSLKAFVEIPYIPLELNVISECENVSWSAIQRRRGEELTFERVDFNDPIWILYSSGTTGQPKAITHSVGGTLIEHLKYLTFHNNVKSGERFFWYTTTGWMMWNYVQASMLAGATIVIYDGSPTFPDISVLWQMIQDLKINHFGTSAPYIMTNMKKGFVPNEQHNLTSLKSISSTGSPLPPEAFDWIYQKVKTDLWLVSMSGGTDVCTAFVGGHPGEAVYEGEIQRRALGCALDAFDDSGKGVVGEVGEMVIVKPMPSMPIYFWNDQNDVRYSESYFETYEGVWRHGDWVTITDRGSLIIHGRSDATLNRHGIRIGTAEIYAVIDQFPEIEDSLIVNLEMDGGEHFMPLFIKMKENVDLNEKLISQLAKQLKTVYTPRHVPDAMIKVLDIPYTLSGKKMESPIKKILMGRSIENSANLGAMRNPNSLDFFVDYFNAHLND